MARQTRAERRARREAQEQTQQPTSRRVRPRQPDMSSDAQAVKGQTAPPRRGRSSFVAESWGELKKVEWPGQSQVIQATVVVLIACIVVGIYLYVNDRVWSPVVKWIIGQ